MPRDYNAAFDLLARNVGRADKAAYIDASTGARLRYGQLAEQAHRFANALRTLGIAPESRVLLCMHDTLEWPVAFLGSILGGCGAGGGEHAADPARLRLHAARLTRGGAAGLPRFVACF